MSELDLDAIKAHDYRRDQNHAAAYRQSDLAAVDVPALVAEVERLRAKLDAPCGSCHPCSNYADETWRAAGRKPPHVYEWDEMRAAVQRAWETLRIWRDEREMEPQTARLLYEVGAALDEETP